MILEENFARHPVAKTKCGGPGNALPGIVYYCSVKLSLLVNTRTSGNDILYAILSKPQLIGKRGEKIFVARVGEFNFFQPFPQEFLHEGEKSLLFPTKFQKSPTKQRFLYSFVFQKLLLLSIQVNFQFENLIKFFWIFIKEIRIKGTFVDFP